MLKNKILATTLSVSLLAPLANPLLENAKAQLDMKTSAKEADISIKGQKIKQVINGA